MSCNTLSIEISSWTILHYPWTSQRLVRPWDTRRTDVVNGAEWRENKSATALKERERGKEREKKKEEMRDAAGRAPGSKIHRERGGARQVLGDCQSCNTHKRQVLECIDCLCPLSVSLYRPCICYGNTPFSPRETQDESLKRPWRMRSASCSEGDYPYFHPDGGGGFV